MAFIVTNNADLIVARIAENAKAAMDAAGVIGVEAVQNQMLYGYGIPHGPDGHTEIVDTGRLFDSITAETSRSSQNLVSVSVGTGVSYAGYVHNGTYKMTARPFIRDAIMNPDTQERMKSAIASQIGQGI